MKTLIKTVRKLWYRIKPVSCRRCQGFLYRKNERARGISNACRRREIAEKVGAMNS